MWLIDEVKIFFSISFCGPKVKYLCIPVPIFEFSRKEWWRIFCLFMINSFMPFETWNSQKAIDTLSMRNLICFHSLFNKQTHILKGFCCSFFFRVMLQRNGCAYFCVIANANTRLEFQRLKSSPLIKKNTQQTKEISSFCAGRSHSILNCCIIFFFCVRWIVCIKFL